MEGGTEECFHGPFLQLFLESYNKKRPSNILDINQVHFAKAG